MKSDDEIKETERRHRKVTNAIKKFLQAKNCHNLDECANECLMNSLANLSNRKSDEPILNIEAYLTRSGVNEAKQLAKDCSICPRNFSSLDNDVTGSLLEARISSDKSQTERLAETAVLIVEFRATLNEEDLMWFDLMLQYIFDEVMKKYLRKKNSDLSDEAYRQRKSRKFDQLESKIKQFFT